MRLPRPLRYPAFRPHVNIRNNIPQRVIIWNSWEHLSTGSSESFHSRMCAWIMPNAHTAITSCRILNLESPHLLALMLVWGILSSVSCSAVLTIDTFIFVQIRVKMALLVRFFGVTVFIAG